MHKQRQRYRILPETKQLISLCVLILYRSGGTYSLKSTPNERFFAKLFMAILFTLRVFSRNLLRGIAEEILFVFCFDVWPGIRTLAFRLISLLDHGDFSTFLKPVLAQLNLYSAHSRLIKSHRQYFKMSLHISFHFLQKTSLSFFDPFCRIIKKPYFLSVKNKLTIQNG